MNCFSKHPILTKCRIEIDYLTKYATHCIFNLLPYTILKLHGDMYNIFLPVKEITTSSLVKSGAPKTLCPQKHQIFFFLSLL